MQYGISSVLNTRIQDTINVNVTCCMYTTGKISDNN